MPWYVSIKRLIFFSVFASAARSQAQWIVDAEDRYRRSLTWQPVVATVFEHKIVFNKGGASHIWYRFRWNGQEHVGDRFKSGGVFKEEHLRTPTLLGVGTELIVYCNPADPSESALKLSSDRKTETFVAVAALICAAVAYRAVRCETIFPNMIYRFLNVNRRIAENTGMRMQRKHNMHQSRYANTGR